MRIINDKAVFNRALFTGRTLDSSAITALVTLIHRFTEAGDYELFVRRDGQLVARSPVQVVGALPSPPPGSLGGGDGRAKMSNSGAPNQVNIDLATFGESANDCYPDPACVLATGGVMGFYVSQGTGRYTVTITRIIGDKKETVLDNAKGLPAGDFFAVTLLRPGIYSVINRLADAKSRVKVDMPKRDSYRAGQATLVQAVQGGFDAADMSLVFGQSLVFQCQVPSQFVVELVEPAPETVDREPDDGGRRRHTVRKRRPPQNP